MSRRYFFRLLHPEYLAFGSVSYEPCPKTNFSYYLFPLTARSPHFRFWVPANHLASLSLSCQAIQVRSPSIKICGSPLCDLHSFLTVTLWRLATVHSNERIVLILFLSSQWDTTWHQGDQIFIWNNPLIAVDHRFQSIKYCCRGMWTWLRYWYSN